MSKKINVSNDILFFAFRYALGRKTYASSEVIENIKNNISEIDTNDIKSYIKEILECTNYGMAFDKDRWIEFKDYLQKELKEREND